MNWNEMFAEAFEAWFTMVYRQFDSFPTEIEHNLGCLRGTIIGSSNLNLRVGVLAVSPLPGQIFLGLIFWEALEMSTEWCSSVISWHVNYRHRDI